MVLDRLPKVLGGIVSGAVKLDAFLDRVPVGENARGNRRGGTPAVQGVLPFFLHLDEGVGVTGRGGFVNLGQGVAEFPFGVGQKSFEGTLVEHGDYAAFDTATQEFAGELASLGFVERVFPMRSLRVEV